MYRIELESPLDYLDYREGSGGSCEVFDIVVGTQRGAGKGSRMLQELKERLKGSNTLVWAFVRLENELACSFYRKNGMRLMGVVHCMYTNVDASTGAPLYTDACLYGMVVK